MVQKSLNSLNLSLKLIFCIIVLALMIQSQEIISDQQRQILKCPHFEKYVKIFLKDYDEYGQEYKACQIIYNQRVKYYKQALSNPSLSFKMGCNQFTDRSDQQMLRRTKLQINETQIEQEGKRPKKLQQIGGIPTSLDWRARGAVTSVKNQGDCGACWTFATNAYGQSKMIIQKKATLDIDLSEQYLLSCTNQCSCQGGYLQYVFEKASGGVPLQSDYPYLPNFPTNPFICWTGNKQYFGYIPEKMYKLSDRDLEILLQKGPVAISISSYKWLSYSSGIFNLCDNFSKVDHAVLLVGYTPDYWIVKNQWGVNWGENGYIRISKNRLNNCKIGTSAFIMWESIYTLTIYALVFFLMIFT